MNIVLISTSALRTPPEGDRYGGMEREAWWLADGLGKRGHTVTLVAHPNSQKPYGGNLVNWTDERQIHLVVDAINEIGPQDVWIDMSHDHLLSVYRPDLPQVNYFSIMSLTGKGINPVFISHGQKVTKFPSVDGKVIYYGLPLDEYPLYEGKRENYIIYLGQKIPEKRLEWACKVSINTRTPLHIYGPGWGPAEYHDRLRAYAEAHPKLICIWGEIGGWDKIDRLQHAKALIHPVGALDWCEAGAICVLEALAVGTPCIVSRNGCLPEYIEDSPRRVGFVCDNIIEMCGAVALVEDINPEDCRIRAMDFTVNRMVTEWESLARQVADGLYWNTS